MNYAIILFATEKELQNLYKMTTLEVGNVKEVENLRGIKIIVSVIGVGRAAEKNIKSCIEQYSPICIILAGSARGISKQVRNGDVFLAANVVTSRKKIDIEYNALQGSILQHLLKNNFKNVHYSGLFCAEHFIKTEEEKQYILLETGTIAVDMESIFVAEICNNKRIMFSILKIIIDDNCETDHADSTRYLASKNRVSKEKEKQNNIEKIHDAIISGVNDMANNSFKTYFAYLDILGFKRIVQKNTTKYLKYIVDDFFSSFSQAVDESRTLPDESKINLRELNFRLYSDSILVWTQNSRYPVFNNLIQALIALFRMGFKKKLPLRGVLTYGDIIIKEPDYNSHNFFSNEAIYGKALVDAYTREAEQNWSGCLVTEQAWNAMKKNWSRVCTNSDSPICYFNQYPYLVWTSIPRKKYSKQSESIALNWNALGAWNPNNKTDELEIESAFGEEEDQEIKLKKTNTIKFLHLTNEIIDKFKIGKNNNIAIPPENYGNTEKL